MSALSTLLHVVAPALAAARAYRACYVGAPYACAGGCASFQMCGLVVHQTLVRQTTPCSPLVTCTSTCICIKHAGDPTPPGAPHPLCNIALILQVQSGALCYPECRDGYSGVGPMCWRLINGETTPNRRMALDQQLHSADKLTAMPSNANTSYYYGSPVPTRLIDEEMAALRAELKALHSSKAAQPRTNLDPEP